MSFVSFKSCAIYKLLIYKSHMYNIYKQDLALNNLQELICLKTQPNQIKI